MTASGAVTARDRDESARVERLSLTSVENLICAGLVLGLFLTSFEANAFGGAAPYVALGLGISACIVGVAIVFGFAPQTRALQRGGRDRDLLVILACGYFIWTGAQNYLLQSNLLGAGLSLISLLVVCGTLMSDLERMNTALRGWLLIVVVMFLVPALQNQGFEAGERVWLNFLPGRYFGFSNPNALAFLAGFAILLAVPVLRQGLGRMLALLGTTLLLLTAGNATAVAVGLALFAYLGLGKVRKVGLLKFSIAAFALATPTALLWLGSDNALRLLVGLQARFDLSGRSLLWVSLVRLTRDSEHFWTGLGELGVSAYTLRVLGVYSAHSTILQVFLADGFITTVLFVLVATLAANRILNTWASERTQDARIAFAVVVYWFVVSLTSAQPGTALVFSLVTALAVAGSRAPGSQAAPDDPSGKGEGVGDHRTAERAESQLSASAPGIRR